MRTELARIAAAGLLAACAVDEPRLPATHVADWRDEIVYQIVVDRFDNGDWDNDWIDGIGPVPGDLARYQGGDWAGIEQRLGYLERLGVTALWISPIVANVPRHGAEDGYHGYWAADFTALEPRFGTLDDLTSLVDAAHARGIKVIIDVVANHAGPVFAYDLNGDAAAGDGEWDPAFDARGYAAPLVWTAGAPRLFEGQGDAVTAMSLSADDFHRRGAIGDWLDLDERRLGDFPTGLRDVATERERVAAALVDTWVHWIELTDVDGLRLDAADHVEPAFWRAFCAQLRERLAARGKRELLLVAEAYQSDPAALEAVVEAGFDGAFDYPLKWTLIDEVLLRGAPPARATALLEAPRAGWIAFADNHDQPRIRAQLDDPRAAELAMIAVLTLAAIPSIYYGTEQGFSGGWTDAARYGSAREILWQTYFREDTRMFGHLRRLIAARKQSLALRRGALVVRHASETGGRDGAPNAGALVYERVHPDDRAVVALNANPSQAAALSVDTGVAVGTRLCDALDPDYCVEVSAGGAVSLSVPPRAGRVLLPR